MPTPRADESRSDFLDRCIPQVLDEGTADSPEQAVAICSSMFERGGDKSASKHRPEDRKRRTMTALADGASLRTARFQGRRHLVAPVVMLVGDSVVRPMGSRGPELVPSSVLAEAPSQWNGRPIVATHPLSGTASANSPRILEDMQFGTVFGATFKRGALRAEAWFDLERAKELGGDSLEAVSRLEEGERLEISVGAWVSLIESPGITEDGKRFLFRWANVSSDHLAVGLGGHEGACSVEMGCGVPRLNSTDNGTVLTTPHDQALLRAARDAEPRAAVRSTARRPTFRGTESSRWSAPTFMDYVNALFDGDDPPSTVRDAPASLRRAIAAHTLLGDPTADSFRELSFFPVVRPSTGRLNERALRAVLGGRGSQANIPASARESARDMARRLLNSEFDADLEVSMMDLSRRGLFARVLDAFGLDLNKDDELKNRLADLVEQSNLDSGAVDSRADNPEAQDESDSGVSVDKEARARAEIERAKRQHVDTLIESPDSPFVESDREALMNFSLDQLWRLAFGDQRDGATMMESDTNDSDSKDTDTHMLECNCSDTCTCQDHADEVSGDESTTSGVMAESDSDSNLIPESDRPAQDNTNQDSSGESDTHSATEQEVTQMGNDTKVARADEGKDGGKDLTALSDRKELVTAVKKDLIGLVINSSHSPFEPDDWAQLESFSEDRLRSLAVAYMPEPEPQTDEEWLATAPPNFQSFYRRAMAQEAGQREELIRGLNQHQDEFSVEELRMMNTETLEKLAKATKLTKHYDYSGRGLPVVSYNDDTAPPDPYEAGLEKRRASYSN